MTEYDQKINIAISEINKILKVISAKDVSNNSISAIKLIESWLSHIQKNVVEMVKSLKSPESTDLARANALSQSKDQMPNKQDKMQEMTSMGASSAAGVAGGIDLGSDKEKEEEDSEDDSLYLKEGTLPLRKLIRNTLYKMYESNNETNLVKLLEELDIGEPPQLGEEESSVQKVNTGTGLAENVFKQIAGNIEDQYNLLKTSEQQRQSFTKHLERALQVGTSQLQVEFNSNKNNISGNNLETKTGDKNKQEQFARDVQIPGLDETGKGFALKTYNDIFSKIATALNGDKSITGLNDPSDRESFIKVIINKVQQLCNSLEEHMKPQKPIENGIETQLQSTPSSKTNANSNFLMP